MTAATTAERLSPPAEGRRLGRIRWLMLGARNEPLIERVSLWAVLLLATVLYAWNLSANGWANQYYTAAIRSGMESWKAFFFGALDSSSFITVDKPPLFLWVEGISVRIIGFNSWGVLLPQAIEGVATVGVLYVAVRRSFGHWPGLIAAAVLALTPITVAINRDNLPDTLMLLLMVLGAWGTLEAIRSGRLLYLVLASAAVGLAFNAKMLQGFIAVPAMVAVYCIAAPGSVRRRIGHLLVAGVTLAAVAGAWVAIVQLWPASSRPYVGGSEDGTAWDLLIGYNGVGRIFGNEGPGGPGNGGGANFGGEPGLWRLFNAQHGVQIAWLIPFAFIVGAAAIAYRGRCPRTDRQRAALMLWLGWLATHFAVFSFASGTYHPYYTTAMAPAIGALVGAGVVMLVTARRARAAAWTVLIGATAGTAYLATDLLGRDADYARWAIPVVWVGAAAMALLALSSLWLPRQRLALGGALAAMFIALLAGPAAYAATPLDTNTGGPTPAAGPSGAQLGFGGPGDGGRGNFTPPSNDGTRLPPGYGSGNPPANDGSFTPPGDSGTFTPAAQGGPGGGNLDDALVQYLVANRNGASWIVAVSSSQEAAPTIIDTGEPVMAIGGFTGSDNALSVDQLKEYVAAGKLRYFIAGGGRGGFGGGDAEVTRWVEEHGTLVDASEWGGSDSSVQLYLLTPEAVS